MLNCEIHGAQDLRLTEVAPEALGPTQVRVGVKAVGICGSDLHYYRHGRVGDFVIREPLTPGHEASGQVLEVGAAVTRVKPGDRVALDPARTCGVCRYCRQGDSNHCEAVHFSAAPAAIRMQGAMREQVVVQESQCLPVPDSLSFELAAFASAGGGAARGAQRRHAAGQDGDGGGRRPHRGAGRDGGPAGRRQPRHRGGHRRPDAGRLRAGGRHAHHQRRHRSRRAG